jgi:hypothetical protein
VGLYTDTSKLKWIFWTSHHSVLPIDMLLKSSRNLSTRTNGSSGLQIHNNQSMTKTTLTNSLPKTSPSHRKRRVTGRQRRTPKNGAISTKSPGTTPMNVAQNSHWWMRSKTDHQRRPHCYFRDCSNSTRRTNRSRRGGAPFSFTYVGEGDPTAFYC